MFERLAGALRYAGIACIWMVSTAAAAGTAEPLWYEEGADGPRVHLYFFRTARCPHCQAARPDVAAMARELPWLVVHDYEVSADRDGAALYVRMARALGEEARSVPAFLFCERMVTGYDNPQGTGALLREALRECRKSRAPGNGARGDRVPHVAEGDELLARAGLEALAHRSLPLITVAIAALDAFNPCAFFVLLFLLSLLVHAGGRARMLLVGGLFVLVSGLVYFALMAAWLNVFLITGGLALITVLAGIAAIAMAALNIKDFVRPGRGPSLSIPERAKPGLYQHVRGLLHAERLPALLAGTAVLAIAANSYELLCTAGFPMVYTRLLTLHALGTGAYYLYLALYNVVYVLPLLAIVVAFTWTLGSRKLQAHEGRLLKLLSGTMMLELGAMLLIAPGRLGDLRVAAGLIAVAVAVTAAAWLYLRRRPPVAPGG